MLVPEIFTGSDQRPSGYRNSCHLLWTGGFPPGYGRAFGPWFESL